MSWMLEVEVSRGCSVLWLKQ